MAEIIDQYSELKKVNTLSALCPVLNKPQDLIHFFHIHFFSLPTRLPRHPSPPLRIHNLNPCESHQNLMLRFDFHHLIRLIKIESGSIILEKKRKSKRFFPFSICPHQFSRTYPPRMARRRASSSPALRAAPGRPQRPCPCHSICNLRAVRRRSRFLPSPPASYTRRKAHCSSHR